MLLAEIDRLRSTATCAYCNEDVPRGREPQLAHMMACESRPESVLNAEIARLRGLLADALRGEDVAP